MPLIITVPTEQGANAYHHFVRITDGLTNTVDLHVLSRSIAHHVASELELHITGLTTAETTKGE